MRWRHVAMAVTIVVFLASVAIIGFKGFNYALDFTGGTLIEARFDKAVDVEQVRTKLEESGFDGAQVQSVGGNTDLLIRLAPHGEHAPGTVHRRQPGHRAAQRVRWPADRQGPGDEWPVRHHLHAGRLPDLHRGALRMEVRGHRQHRGDVRPDRDGGLRVPAGP
ncbi:hypothetical protein G6F57_014038 [Rhizopus arrhizus]|nr:hypothetical protein G6F57_014038 [Rhizopus arrhizus]